ncbi:GNAT family N-acetyltransferase [Phytohabitans flavus]|uniref:Acetyltransferase n=1 Tax=Phytohabitans flavus TaxID=1076124 RepID=A0A6F8XLK3_9ACTN|nr:acetyltransferase [Phytohabitans flavus]
MYDVEPQLANNRDYWLGYGRAGRLDGDVTLYRSDVRHPQLNGVLRVREGALEAALTEVKRLDGLPRMWWVGPDSYPELGDDLAAAGGVQVGAIPVMAVALDRVTELPSPPDLSIVEVPGVYSLREWVESYAPSMGVTPDQLEVDLLMEQDRPDGPGELVRFAALLDGKVVGTAALLDRAGVAGVYVVTTREEYRRRGIAAATTAAALDLARLRGLRVATLQASEAGAEVYRRMGFETVATYQIFGL